MMFRSHAITMKLKFGCAVPTSRSSRAADTTRVPSLRDTKFSAPHFHPDDSRFFLLDFDSARLYRWKSSGRATQCGSARLREKFHCSSCAEPLRLRTKKPSREKRGVRSRRPVRFLGLPHCELLMRGTERLEIAVGTTPSGLRLKLTGTNLVRDLSDSLLRQIQGFP